METESDKSRRIIVAPLWNDAHIFPMWLENQIEVLEPTHIIINEGLWPVGSEGGGLGGDYHQEFTRNGRSFDLDLVMAEMEKASREHLDIQFDLNLVEYSVPKGLRKPENSIWCWQHALDFGLPEDLSPDDVLIVGEIDMLFHEDHKDLINNAIDELAPGNGLVFLAKRFFVSPFVLILDDLRFGGHMGRECPKIIKWGDGTLWKNFADIYIWGRWENENKDPWKRISYKCAYNRHNILPLWHYEWIKPGRYFNHKLAQLPNRGPKLEGYTKAHNYINEHNRIEDGWMLLKEGKLINVPDEDHPIHIHEHTEYKRFAIKAAEDRF